MFPHEGEAGDCVPGRGGTAIMSMCERDYVLARVREGNQRSYFRTRGRPTIMFPDKGGGQGLCFRTRGRPTIVFPREGEAGDCVPGEGGTAIMSMGERGCVPARVRGGGRHSYSRARGRPTIVFPDEGEAKVYVSRRGGGRRSCSLLKSQYGHYSETRLCRARPVYVVMSLP